MPQTSTQKPGKSTLKNIKDVPEGEVREARITTCGLLNSIIQAGVSPAEWEKQLIFALNVHRYGYRRLLGTAARKPKWSGD